jgi:uncharacterized membrane protein (UPF0127 family)
MSNRNKRRRAANKATWIKIVAFGFIAIFLGGYVVDSFMSMNSMRSKSSNEDNVAHINIPFSPQGVVTVREAQAGGGILYSGDIEIADNEGRRAQGLMYRDSLAYNQGMLFIFPEEEMQAFWMKNTRISLDIIYINSNGRVVSIIHSAVPHDETSRPSLAPAQYVLELPGGTCEKSGIKAGCMVSWIRTDEE